MLRKCPHCGFTISDDEIVFCPSCRELIDQELNLINDINKILYQCKNNDNKIEEKIQKENKSVKIQTEDDSNVVHIKEERKGTDIIWIVLAVIIIAVVLAMILF